MWEDNDSMEYLIAVDFGPRFSACAVMDEWGELLAYEAFDVGPESLGFDVHAFALDSWVESLSKKFPSPSHVVVEDVSHFMAKPAQALRLQGAFRAYWRLHTNLTCIMVFPQVWQNYFGWRKTPGMTSKGFAAFALAVLGYSVEGTKGKATVDVRDAVLIARWAVGQFYGIVDG